MSVLLELPPRQLAAWLSVRVRSEQAPVLKRLPRLAADPGRAGDGDAC